MSQDTSTNERDTQTFSRSSSIQPWSVDVKADQLMDEIFSDIDRILEGGSASPTEPAEAKPEYVSLQPIKIPQITALSPTWIPPEDHSSESLRETGSALARPTPLDLELIDTTAEEREKRRGSSLSFDKLLLGVACASLAVTALLWLASQDKFLLFSSTPSAEVATNQKPQAKLDEQFANYMVRSLDVITRRAEAKKQKATANLQPTTNLPPVPPNIPGNAAQNRGPGVIERVYIPIYQPPPNPVPVKPVPTPPPQIATRVPAPPVLPTVPPVIPSVIPIPASPAPASSTPPQAVPPPTPVAEPTPAAIHTLVGLLELGERSAALFNISGSTQRIQVGEAIGSSGWILVSVSNQEALIRRNGEVRSIYVGQKF